MNAFAVISLVAGLTGVGQHGSKPAAAMSNVNFLVGDWKGKQTFMIGKGNTMVGDATDHAEWAVGGRFIEEHLSTTLPNQGPTDTRHMLAYDPKTGQYMAYWFNDTSPLPMIMTGKLEGSKLVLVPSATPGAPQQAMLRFTYDGSTPNQMTLTFQMQRAGKWQLLFKSVYSK
ncbi:MAG: DUF1579 family protein [Fimbriimonadaceae bacterium]